MAVTAGPQDTHEDLLAQRGAEYGDAYARTDEWVRQNLERLAASPSPLGLIMIHFKLERALCTPTKRDHYDDLIGYAKLVLRALDRDRPANHWLTAREEEAIREQAMRGDLNPDSAVQRALDEAASRDLEDSLRRMRYAQGRG